MKAYKVFNPNWTCRDFKFEVGKANTGDWNTGDWNTGDRNTGDSNTGELLCLLLIKGVTK